MVDLTNIRFYVVCGGYDGESKIHQPNERVWTISTSPDIQGWNTDGGYDGYGLTEPIAKFLVNAANKELNRIRNG